MEMQAMDTEREEGSSTRRKAVYENVNCCCGLSVFIMIGVVVAFVGFIFWMNNTNKKETSKMLSLMNLMAESNDKSNAEPWRSFADGDNKSRPLKTNQMYLYNIGQMAGDPYAIRDCYGPFLKRSFPDLDYALFGYNILRGYPLAIGHDPGFTFPLFAANYDEPHYTADCRYSLPQGIAVVPDVSCVTSFTSKTVQNSYEFSKSLSVSAEASGGGWGVKFSASAGYKKSSSEMASGESLFILSEARCNYYFSKLDQINPPPLHPSFMKLAKRLENTDNEENYFDFFSYYGTHFLTEVTFGARYTHQHKMSSSKYKREKAKGVNVAVQASYSGLFSVGGGFSLDSSQREQASNFQKNVETTTVSVGATPPANGDAMTWASAVKDSPVPMAYRMDSIEELFTEKYMSNYNLNYTKIYRKIKYSEVKLHYCEFLLKNGETDSCTELIPYIEIKGKEIYGWFGNSPSGVSKSTCINLCIQNDLCVEAEFTEGDNLCEMNHHTSSHTIFSNDRATLMIFTTKLMLSGKDLILEHAKVITNIPKRENRNGDITKIEECKEACLRDPICFVFMFRTPTIAAQQKTKTCTLYSEKALGYDPTPVTEIEAEGHTTVFIARALDATSISPVSTSASPASRP